jgi:hypothetical protein
MLPTMLGWFVQRKFPPDPLSVVVTLAPGAMVAIGLPSLITSTCESPVEFLQVIDPPLGTCTGFGLNAPLPEELTMLTVLPVAVGAGDGLVGAGVLLPPPPLPPHASVRKIGAETMSERVALSMCGWTATPVPRKSEQNPAADSVIPAGITRGVSQLRASFSDAFDRREARIPRPAHVV